jgi:hypothetical protein
LKTIALLSLVLAHGIFSGLVWADSPGVGRVLWVIDGDTFQISHAGAPEGEPVRARLFDTPEKGERAHCEAEWIKAGQATAFARSLLPRPPGFGRYPLLPSPHDQASPLSTTRKGARPLLPDQETSHDQSLRNERS